MNDKATTPLKARITHAQQVRWMEAAVAFMEEGESPAGVRAWLQDEGCPPRLRDELLRQATAKLKGEHRRIGLGMLALGIVLTAGGAYCGYGAFNGVPVGDGMRMAGGGLFKLGVGLLLGGVPLLFYGGWKVLSGSIVAAPAAR